MKAKEVHDMTNVELAAKLMSLKSDLFYLRFNNTTGNLANPQQLVVCKKDIARVMTVIREREMSGKDVAQTAPAVKTGKKASGGVK